jgi:NodT family efflux transporter outer membrane factor (OMF) lipoprotein
MNNQSDAVRAARATVSPAKLRHTVMAGLLALAGIASLSGCAVGPAYVAPQASMPAAYQGAPASAARQATAAPALDTWWEGFHDPALQRIVTRVLEQNLDLAAALARIEQARAGAHAAAANQMPSVGLSADAGVQRQSLRSPLGRIGSSAPGYDRNQSFSDVGLGASWEADLFGGLKSSSHAADAELQAAEAERLGVRVSVAAEAADAYFRVRGAQRRIALAQEQVATNGRLLELVKLRQEGGLSASRESAQAEALVAQARATIPPLRAELAVQLNRLDVLMGAHPGTYAAELAAPAGLGEIGAVPSIPLAQGPADLLRRRPDVIAAERRVAASNARIGVAMAEYYPKVSLSSLLGLASVGGGLLNSGAAQGSAALGLRWRLFDFGRIDAEVEQAKGANAEALVRYRQSLLRATEDVENAVATLVEFEAQHGELQQEVAAHLRARDASEDAYKGGAVSLYEVLEEDRQLLASRDQMARVQADNARAAVAAFRALGGGW